MAKDIKKLLAEKLQQNNQRHTLAQDESGYSEGKDFIFIPVHLIDPNPYQPRKIFPQDELEKLASSIAEIGLIEPIILRKNNDRYQIAAGERRWRAHILLNKNTISAIVTNIPDSDMAVIALAENFDREDLSDFEICSALRQIENLFPTKKKLAEAMGMNREDMYKYFSFEDLPDFIISDLHSNPRLLSRSAATDIKRIINQVSKDESFDKILHEAWSLLINKQLDQTKLTNYLINAIKNKSFSEKNSHVQSAHNFLKDGKKVGWISWSNKHITIKLNSNQINQEQEQSIKSFLEKLINEAKNKEM